MKMEMSEMSKEKMDEEQKKQLIQELGNVLVRIGAEIAEKSGLRVTDLTLVIEEAAKLNANAQKRYEKMKPLYDILRQAAEAANEDKPDEEEKENNSGLEQQQTMGNA